MSIDDLIAHLNDRHTQLRHPLGVNVAGNVALDNGGGRGPHETWKQRLQQRCLSATGRTNQVDSVQAFRVKPLAVFPGALVVGLQYVSGGYDFHQRLLDQSE